MIIYLIIILLYYYYIFYILIVCHQRDHILQVQLAAHICVLVNRYLLQNSWVRGDLYTRYPIVARALGLAAECAREQRYLAYKGVTDTQGYWFLKASIFILIFRFGIFLSINNCCKIL